MLRVLIFAGFFIALISAGGSFSIYTSYQAEREQRLDAESRLVQIQDSSAAMKADIEQQKSRIADLEAQVQAMKTSDKSLKDQLAAKESELLSLRTEADSKASELVRLQGQLENYRKKERTPVALPNQGGAVGPASGDAPKVNVPQTTFSSTSNSSAVAPAAPVAPLVVPAEAPASDDSRILTVNRKFNFIVVNLGLRDGLRMGDKVQVMQNGTQKALAQIEKIYDKFSAATLLDENKGNPVHEGDSVRKV